MSLLRNPETSSRPPRPLRKLTIEITRLFDQEYGVEVLSNDEFAGARDAISNKELYGIVTGILKTWVEEGLSPVRLRRRRLR